MTERTPRALEPSRWARASRVTGWAPGPDGSWPSRPSEKAAWSAADSLLASRARKLSCWTKLDSDTGTPSNPAEPAEGRHHGENGPDSEHGQGCSQRQHRRALQHDGAQ